jgi:hypothetical protein
MTRICIRVYKEQFFFRVGDYKLLYGENPDEIDSTKRLQLFDLKSEHLQRYGSFIMYQNC